MGDTYTLSTETINDIIKRIPQERWEAFCSELPKYLEVHYNITLISQGLSELGMGEMEIPKTFGWTDDGDNSVDLKVVLKEEE